MASSLSAAKAELIQAALAAIERSEPVLKEVQEERARVRETLRRSRELDRPSKYNLIGRALLRNNDDVLRDATGRPVKYEAPDEPRMRLDEEQQ